ncbi:alpha/beta fold hydrolase [Anderseniella sp. Alg231-50]|uniref:alpha/beta fold hydrolase n=1 Tax=Anderseniella sp. Alg231-50 TaxID=1922226 RepID=UPI000D5601AC
MQLSRSAIIAVCLVLCALVSACAKPELLDTGPAIAAASLNDTGYTTTDGEKLQVSNWKAASPRAVIVAVHGFNEYAGSFQLPGPWFSRRGISVYAYDQRGFGRADAERLGKWAGGDVMARDLSGFVELVRRLHPRVPIYVVGTSMGGAVTMKASVDHGLKADGLVLVAPAIWGWRSMNPILKSALWVTAHTVPDKTASGSQLEIWPSDNIEWLKAYSKDKYNIRQGRFDTLYGLVTLMDEAAAAAPKITAPVLYLYGLKDQVVPEVPSRKVMASLTTRNRQLIYENGYHMLLHDLQREIVYRDILSWIGADKVATPVAALRSRVSETGRQSKTSSTD